MRHITTWSGWVILAIAALSVYLYWQQREQHARVTEVALRREVARLEQVRAGLEKELRTARHVPTTKAMQTAFAAARSAPPETAGVVPTSSSMQRVPEMTDEQRQWVTSQKYQRIFRELALSQAEIAAALPVLVQQDLRAKQSPPIEDVAQRNQNELAEVLGAENAAHFAAQRRLLPVRADIKMLRMRLEDSEHPLSAQQQDSLLEILAGRASEVGFRRAEGEDWRQSQERVNAWMRERDQRLRKDAAIVEKWSRVVDQKSDQAATFAS